MRKGQDCESLLNLWVHTCVHRLVYWWALKVFSKRGSGHLLYTMCVHRRLQQKQEKRGVGAYKGVGALQDIHSAVFIVIWSLHSAEIAEAQSCLVGSIGAIWSQVKVQGLVIIIKQNVHGCIVHVCELLYNSNMGHQFAYRVHHLHSFITYVYEVPVDWIGLYNGPG